MAQASIWWRARTARERLLLQAAAVLLFVLLTPLWAYSSAAQFRAAAAAERVSAQQVHENVTRLASAAGTRPSGAFPGSDGALRGLAMAAAEAEGLTVSRVEPAGADRVRISVAPTASLAIYRWIDSVSRRGAFVSSAALTRSGEGDLVAAELELSESP